MVTSNLGTTEPVCVGLCWFCPHEEITLRNYQFLYWNATCKVPPPLWSCHQGEQGQLYLFLPLPMFMEIAFVLLEFILTLFQTWRKVAKIAQSVSTCSPCGYFLSSKGSSLPHLFVKPSFPPPSCLCIYIYMCAPTHLSPTLVSIRLSSVCPSTHISIHISFICLPISPPTRPSISLHLSIHIPTHLSTSYLPISSPTYTSIHL